MDKSLAKFVWRVSILCMIVAADSEKLFSIQKTWDSKDIEHDPVLIKLSSSPNSSFITMQIKAPFFNDPPPPNGIKGQPYEKLWDYEVVEAFFLNENDDYLEVEFSPHGQHLLLLLSGAKNAIKMCLPLEYVSSIERDVWNGAAQIPKSYFPPSVTLFNAYCIHGSGINRTYEALYPVPTGQFDYPDFHRLSAFQPIEFSTLIPKTDAMSDVWKEAISNQKKEELICRKS